MFAQLQKVLQNSQKTDQTMVRSFKNEGGQMAQSHIVIPVPMQGFQETQRDVAE